MMATNFASKDAAATARRARRRAAPRRDAISEYHGFESDGGIMWGVAEQRKREVTRRSTGARGRDSRSVVKGEAENTYSGVSLSTSNSLYSLPLARPPAASS